jgi:predicted MFS family arabinose efflux permease
MLAAAQSVRVVFLGAAVWGLHTGMTQGLLSTLVGDTCQEDLRGTAFGILNLLSGASLLVGSVLAGLFWTMVGPVATFLVGARIATLALIGFIARNRSSPTKLELS